MSIALAVPQLALRPISKGRAALQPSKKPKKIAESCLCLTAVSKLRNHVNKNILSVV
jgi:hypothetical protein